MLANKEQLSSQQYQYEESEIGPVENLLITVTLP